MQHSKEKVPKKGVHTFVALLVIAVTGAAILSIGATTSSAYAARGDHGTPRTETGTGQPTDPNCWGEINSGLAQASGGVGQHASDPVPGDDDRETPRLGVGNQPEGTPSDHAAEVGPQFGQTCEP
jgi:hypothetical protein